jgi:hypothetical protein
MKEQLKPQEVALLIRARQILKAKGLAKDADVKSICEAAGVSRKTGYRWADNLDFSQAEEDNVLGEELAGVKAQYEDLKARHRRLEIENEGHKLSWEIHGVDELLAAKKNTTRKDKKKKR